MEDVVIIGAGPYGLSVAANLRKHGIPYRVLGRRMHMWSKRMPQGMLLKSDGCATNLGAMPLTLKAFCQRTNRAYRDTGHRVPINDMITYGETFADEYVGSVEDQQVETIISSPSGFQIKLQSGEDICSKRVVVATGLYYLKHLPQIPGIDGRLSHASEHHDLSRFAGQRVAVIGGGQSALETAALLHEMDVDVTVVGRSSVSWFPPDDLPRTLYRRVRTPYLGLAPGWKTWLWSSPSAFWRLPSKVRLAYAYSTFQAGGTNWIRPRLERKVRFVVGKITGATVGQDIKLMVDDRSISVDHVIAGTGFVPDLRRVPFLAPLLGQVRWMTPGMPMLNMGFETSVPGLHVVGYLSAAAIGPGMRFVYGTKYAGPWVAGYIAENR